MKPKINPNDAIWLASKDNDGQIRHGRCINRWLQGREWMYLIETSNGSRNVYHNVYKTREEAEAAFALAVEESRQRAAALPPIEGSPPVIGHAAVDALIAAAWEHGHRVAAAEDGCGSYPGKEEGDEIRRLARAVLREAGVL